MLIVIVTVVIVVVVVVVVVCVFSPPRLKPHMCGVADNAQLRRNKPITITKPTS